MSRRLLIVVFLILIAICAFPVLFIQPFGSASAGLSAGFIRQTGDIYHVAILLAIGLFAALMGGEALVLLPLCTLLIYTIGALLEINDPASHGLHDFILGAIILFALSVSMLHNKSLLVFIAAMSVWAYFAGSNAMHDIPTITTPLFFLMGIIVCNILLLAIAVTLGITINDRVRDSIGRLKGSAAFASFLSFF